MNVQQQIFHSIYAIPLGYVASYGYIAYHAGLTRGARQVAKALKNLPKGSHLPWHRVINAKRSISFPEGSTGFIEQTRRLALEGVIFHNGKVNKLQMLDFIDMPSSMLNMDPEIQLNEFHKYD